jgi:UDPglucose 6-dehydrogenase
MVYGAGLADVGHRVTGLCDTDATAAALNAGRPIIHEHGLPALLRRNLKRGRLRYTTDYRAALEGARFAFISIDTPVRDDDASDLSSILDAARRIGDARSGALTVCVTAQVPVGTTHEIGRLVAAGAGRGRVDVAYVPEFLRLGTAIETFRRADRFVVGADDPAVAKRVAALYAPLRRPTLLTSVRSAEMGKHASNTFLATSISFINEMSDLCEAVGADASAVAAILKADRRIGPHAFLSPGLGFAGGTLGREIKALQKIGAGASIATPMMDAALAVNLRRPEHVTRRLRDALGGLGGRQIGVLGLTYKPGTSTLRRAISVDIMRRLVSEGARLRAYDPLANFAEAAELPPFERSESPYEAADGADAVLLLTEWADIDRMDLRRLRRHMRGRLFFDTRNLLAVDTLRRAGFDTIGIGRETVRGREVS